MITLLCLFLIQCQKDENPDEPEVLTPYHEDFNELKATIISLHPSLHDFSSQQEMNDFFNTQYEKITEETTLNEFYGIASTTIAKIGCGHSYMSLPKSFGDNLLTTQLLPYRFMIYENQLFITRDYGNTSVPIGAQILSIDGNNTSDILQTLEALISADGHRKSAKEYQVMRSFRNLYALIFGVKNEHQLRYKIDGGEANATISSMTYQEIVDEYDRNYATDPTPALNFKLDLDTKTATIRIATFSYYGSNNAEFFSFIDDCFNQIKEKNIENLILDVRGNQGGDPYCGSYLLKHLAKEPYTYFQTNYGDYPDLVVSISPDTNAFTGNLYTLIDGGCGSTTGHFTALLKYHQIGTLVGRETNGTYSCNDGSREHTLTNSRLKYHMAELVYAVAVSGFTKIEGVKPDHIIPYSASNIANGIDTDVAFVMGLIENN